MVEPLVTARDVAKVLGISPKSVLARFNAGQLPGFRLGSSKGPVRFRMSEVEEWLQGRRSGRRAS